MAQNRLIFCLPSAEARLHFLTRKHITPPSLLLPSRGKGKSARPKKIKKDSRIQEMKDYVKRTEMRKLMMSAAMKAAKRGEPLDPEMLNPARKRAPSTLSYEEKDKRVLLTKEWSRYQMQKELKRSQLLRGMVKSREEALKELEKVSSSLYFKALELNPVLFPLEFKAPSETPSIPSYIPPDPEDELK